MKKYLYLIQSQFKKVFKMSAFKEASFYGLSNIVSQIMAFISTIFVSRYLGPTNLGMIAFVQNYSGIFLSFLGGADYYFSWEIGKRENKLAFIKEYITHRFYVAIFMLIIAFVLAYNVMASDMFFYVLIVMLPFVFTALSPLYLYSLYEKRARLIFWVQTLAMIFLFTIKMICVFIGAPILYFIIISGVDIALNSLMYFIYYIWTHKSWRKDLFKLHFFNPIKTLKFYYGILFAVMAPAFWILLLRIDQMMLGFLSSKFPNIGSGGAYNLGIYSAAVKLAELPNVLAGVVYFVLISRLGVMINNGEQGKMKKVFKLYIFAGLFMSAVVFIFAPIMISVVYGAKFLESINVLRIYGLSIVFVYIITYYTALLGAENKHRFQTFVFIFGVIINIICVIVFTIYYGLVGTALATVISYGVVAALLYSKNRKNI